MLIALIRYWQPIAAALATAALALMLHTLSANMQEQKHEYALAQQQSQLIGRCTQIQAQVQAISDSHQKRLAAANRSLDDARRMLNNTCYTVHGAGASSGHNAAAGQQVNGGQDARLAATSLLDYASEAERYRSQLLACQEFVNER